MLQEGVDRVGDGYRVDQQDGVDRQEVQDVHQNAGLHAKVFLDDVREVTVWLGAGQDQASHSAVGPVGHGQCYHRHDDQWDDAADTGVDGEEEDAGADCGSEQGEHPYGVFLIPLRCTLLAIKRSVNARGWCGFFGGGSCLGGLEVLRHLSLVFWVLGFVTPLD